MLILHRTKTIIELYEQGFELSRSRAKSWSATPSYIVKERLEKEPRHEYRVCYIFQITSSPSPPLLLILEQW